MKLGVKGLEITEDNQLVHCGALRGITESNKVSNWSTAETVRVFFSIGSVFASKLKILVVDNAESLDEEDAENHVRLGRESRLPRDSSEGRKDSR